MYNLNGSAAGAVATVALIILLYLLLFSFRDTCQNIRTFYDLAFFRSYFRSWWRWRPKYSHEQWAWRMSLLLIFLAFVIYVFANDGIAELVLLAIAVGYLSIMVIPYFYYFVTDLFGASPRKRWEKYLNKKKPRR